MIKETTFNGTRLPVKLWLPLEEMESKAIEQVKNIANHPEAVDHIAIMPDNHVGYGVPIGAVLPTQDAVVPNAVGVDIGCFVGDTRIPLLDGTSENLFNLTKRNDPFWVYSIDEKGMIVPGKAIAKQTRMNADLVEVIVSGGGIIYCTPDHLFLLRDGTYKAVSELKTGESLMPLYRSYETRDGKEHIKHPNGTSEATHKMVARNISIIGEHIHHDKSRFWDNTPENLMGLTASEHSNLTAKEQNHFTTEDFKQKRLQTLRETKFFERNKENMREVGRRNLLIAQQNHPEAFADNYAKAGQRGRAQIIKNNTSPKECDYCGDILPNLSAWIWHRKKEHNNHKILSVTVIDQKKDVYCLTVEKYHNFALDAGVFVHNCGVAAVNTGLKYDREKMDKEFWRNFQGNVTRNIPVGFNSFHENKPLGNLNEQPLWATDLQELVGTKGAVQIGTLGGGNHFLEVDYDEQDTLWLMVHSGSRHIGLRIAGHYHKLAIESSKKRNLKVLDDLASLSLDEDDGLHYMSDMDWACQYASESRKRMITSLSQTLTGEYPNFDDMINIPHNYAFLERVGTGWAMIHRKGATSAHDGQLGVIPGSMGTDSFIVRGKGNPDSFQSSSHGCGRTMGRGEAKRTFDTNRFSQDIAHTFSKPSEKYLDESPACYKPSDIVINRQLDLIDIIHTLTPIITVKGGGRDD